MIYPRILDDSNEITNIEFESELPNYEFLIPVAFLQYYYWMTFIHEYWTTVSS